MAWWAGGGVYTGPDPLDARLQEFYENDYQDESWTPWYYGGVEAFVRQAEAAGIPADKAREWYIKRYPGNPNDPGYLIDPTVGY